MNPETAVTFTCGHFNQVVFAVGNHALRNGVTAIIPWLISSLLPIPYLHCKNKVVILDKYLVATGA